MIANLVAIVKSLIANWAFAREMARRELKGLNKGSLVGFGWLVLRPLIQTAAYVVIISFMFGARLGPGAGHFDYGLYVLGGMFSWQVAQRGFEDSVGLVRDRAEILKQVVYPIETLPLTGLLVGMFSPSVVLFVFIVLSASSGTLSWTAVLLPIPIVLMAMLIVGVSWIFMVVGVVFRDLKEIIGTGMSLAIYVSPVLLSESMVGPRLWYLVQLNPLSHSVIAFRDVLGGTFHSLSWGIFAIMAILSFLFGTSVISRAKVAINEYL